MAGSYGENEGLPLPKCLLVCRPAIGRRSVGGQKRRWNDVLMEGLKRFDLLE